MKSQDERDEVATKRAREEQRTRAAVERQITAQLQSGTLTAPPKDLQAVPGVTTRADAVRYLEQVYVEQVEQAEAELTDAGLDYELPTLRLELTRQWQAVRKAATKPHPNPPLTTAELGSLTGHLTRFLTLGIEAQVEAAQERQLFYSGHANSYVQEWERTTLKHRQEPLTDEAQALLYGSDQDLRAARGTDGYIAEDSEIEPGIHVMRFRLGGEEA